MSKLSAKKIIRTINKAIALNPTEITFTQIIKTEDDGAFKEEVIEKSITVVIYTEDSGSINITSEIKGTSYLTERYKMIGDKEADLDVTPTEKINFISNGDKFEIKAVYPQIVQGIICGYLCDLERID